MTKKIILTDCFDNKICTRIPNFENVDKIKITKVSGDEILTVTYKDDMPVFEIDSGSGRNENIVEAGYELSVDDIEKFNAISNSSNSSPLSYIKARVFDALYREETDF